MHMCVCVAPDLQSWVEHLENLILSFAECKVLVKCLTDFSLFYTINIIQQHTIILLGVLTCLAVLWKLCAPAVT